jgi:hypothetical protein
MEATGVYWIALYDLLEQAGMEVFWLIQQRPRMYQVVKRMFRIVSGYNNYTVMAYCVGVLFQATIFESCVYISDCVKIILLWHQHTFNTCKKLSR